MQNKKIEIFTDGSCLGNPGPGGWGVIILYDNKEIKLSGGNKDTTNNRMEMTAVIKALDWLRDESGLEKKLNDLSITIHSDSNLIVQTINQGWKKKANVELWAEIDKLRAWLNITWTWVKAHDENQYNNMADELALSEAKKQKANLV